MSSLAPPTSQHREAATVTAARKTAPANHHQGPVPRSLRPLGNQAIQQLIGRHRIQAKLTVNQPGDRFEQEADRVADQVMRMPEPLSSGHRATASIQRCGCAGCQQGAPCEGASPLQRKCASCEEELQRKTDEEEDSEVGVQAKAVPGQEPAVSPEVEGRLGTLRTGGSQLSAAIRGFFEPRFGRNLEDVRIHTDGDAAVAARGIRSRAFTMGSHIAFAAGEYAPGTPTGQLLLAHELVHTVQQGAGRVRSVQRAADPQPAEEPKAQSPAEPDSGSAAGLIINPPISDSAPISARLAAEEAVVERNEESASCGESPEEEAAAESPYRSGMSREALESSLQGGRPLDPGVRLPLESRHGRSLDHVRIHTGEQAASLAQKFSARAFAFGPHIAFSRGAYAPYSEPGQRLLRHEVAHVLQAPRTAPGVFRVPLCPTTCPPAGALPFVAVSDPSFNCYAYVLNSSSSGFLWPGQRASTRQFLRKDAVQRNPASTPADLTSILPYFTPAGVLRNTQADLGSPISTDCTACCSGTNRKVIEVTTDAATNLSFVPGEGWVPMVSASERWDFHWYRKDGDRAWSHKRGGLDAQRNDASGATPICNPCSANRNHGPNYRNVVGSWCV